jgi:hypothetical protein
MCIIMSEKCGGLHSVKWYKENSRVFVYSPISNFKNAEVQSLPTLQYIMHISSICTLGYNDFFLTKWSIPIINFEVKCEKTEKNVS